MSPEEQQVLLTHQFWLSALWFSVAALFVVTLLPTKELDEDGEVIDTEHEENLERRRKNMQCYGKHEWIINTEGLRRCKRCDFEYKEE